MNERDIFLAAVEIADPIERAAYVAQACGTDAGLRAQVEELLKAHKQTSQFLETPAVVPDSAVEQTILSDSSDTDDGPHAERSSGKAEFRKYLEPATRSGWLGRLAHYEIEEILGRGAFGIVAKAFDEKLHRVVAIKLMSPELALTSPPRKRFLREARTAAAVTHENIVAIHAVEEEPIPYLVMEYIPGQTLQQRMDERGPLEVPEVLRIGQQVAAGLAAAHAVKLIHRDIKPSNILLNGGPNERAKISDFGLARAVDDATLTSSGMIAGTPMYMAPEQARGEKLDHRADLFSLGSVLYQMASGRPPFRAANTVAVLKRVCEDTPRALDDVIPETPVWLETIIFRLLEKDRENRYQSAQEVVDVLARCQSELQRSGKVSCVEGRPASAAQSFHMKTDVDTLPVGATDFQESPHDWPQNKAAEPLPTGKFWMVPLLGLLDIVIGVLLLFATVLTLMPEDETDPFVQRWSQATPFHSAVERFNFIEPALGFVAFAALFAAGVGLLMWKPWARRLAMGVCVYELAVFVIGVPFLVLGGLVPMFRLTTDIAFQAAVDVSREEAIFLTIVSVIAMATILTALLVFHVVQLVVLARSDVKHAFERLTSRSASGDPLASFQPPGMRTALVQAKSAARLRGWKKGLLVTGSAALGIGGICCGLALFLMAIIPRQWDNLGAAAARGDAEAVTRLVAATSNPDPREPNGNTPLIVAAGAGHARVVELLIQAGADLEALGAGRQTALCNALLNGQISTARALLQAGADVHAEDVEGRTILHAAVESGDFACMQLVLDQHPTIDPNARLRGGITPLMLAARGQNDSTVRRLLQAGAIVDERSDQGDTALMEAAQCGSPGVVETLLAAGADGTDINQGGWTALDRAVAGGRRIVVDKLLASGAAPTAAYNLWQGFQLAMQGLYAEASPLFSIALEQSTDISSYRQFTLDEWMIETEYPELLALACLAECEVRNGEDQLAQQHYQKLRQRLASASKIVVAVRVWPSPGPHPAGWSDQNNSIYITQVISATALERVLVEPGQAVEISFTRKAVKTLNRGDGVIRNEQNSQGSTRGFFER